MAGLKEIEIKIKTIKSTQKITRAMEMVSASKMRKAQDCMLASRPYAKGVRAVIAHLINGHISYEHPYLQGRKPKRIGLIIISTDRGLCGGLNTNLFRIAFEEMRTWLTQGIDVDLCTIGNKAELFFKRHKANIIAGSPFVGERPMAKEVIGPVKVLLDAYDAKKLDRVFFIYNEFINIMTQKPKLELLLPITNNTIEEQHTRSDYIYEPEPVVLLDALLKRYIESLVYQGLVENAACEQAARMVAMKNATDNAGGLIDEFQLLYNKARQSVITKELSEIVAGAAAV